MLSKVTSLRNSVLSYLFSLKGASRGAKAKRNIIYSLGLKGVSILVSIGYVPLFLNFLDKERYGVWLTFLTIINWFAFFDIGLGNGLRNKLAIALAHKDYLLCKKYLSTTYALLACIFLGLSIIFVCANRFINWNNILNTSIINVHELFVLTNVVVIFFFIRFIVQIIQIVYFSVQQPSVNNLIDTLGTLFAFLILYAFKVLHVKVSLVEIGVIVSSLPIILFLVLSGITYYKTYTYLKPSLKLVDFSLGKDLMSLGGRFFIMQITSIIIFSTSNIFITQFYGPQEVARFNVCFKLFQVVIMVSSIMLSPIWSAVTEAHAKKDYAWLKSTIRKLNLMTIFFSAVIIVIVILSPMIVKIWVHGKIVIPYEMSVFMGIYAIVNIAQAPYSQFVSGFGKLRLQTSLCGVGILLFFVITFMLKKYFNNSSSVILATTLVSCIGLTSNAMQTHKIINGKATGIWNR